MLKTPQPVPVLLGAQPELVDHGQQVGAADTVPRPSGMQAHGGKRGHNRVGRADGLPVRAGKS